MRTMPFGVLVVFLALIRVSFAQTAAATDGVGWGAIEGTVFDDSGKPVSDAIVTAYTKSNGATRDVTKYQTNSIGEFTIKLPEGRVWLSAEKRIEGYPYAFFAFYAAPGQEFPFITVKAGETAKDVVIRLGAKAAHLVYEALDERGTPVAGRFLFNRLDQPDSPYSTSALASDDLLVPATPFRATFEAKGYRPWHFGGNKWQSNEGIVSLKPGEVLNLTIHLQHE